MVRLVVLDIDGVLTDGSIMIDKDGNEQKRLNLKDVDGIFELKKRGFLLAAMTGENTGIVDYFEKRFPWDYFFKGNKKKKEALCQLSHSTGIAQQEICYVGDGKYDIEPLDYAGLGICPANAIDKAKEAADVILHNNGGEGCIWELASFLEEFNNKNDASHFFLSEIQNFINHLKGSASSPAFMHEIINLANEITSAIQNGKTLCLCGSNSDNWYLQYVKKDLEQQLSAAGIRTKVNIRLISTRRGETEKSSCENEIADSGFLLGISTGNEAEKVIRAYFQTLDALVLKGIIASGTLEQNLFMLHLLVKYTIKKLRIDGR